MVHAGPVEPGFKLPFHRFQPGQVREHDMRRKGVFGRADGPDMDMMHGFDARHGGHHPFEFVHPDSVGHAVERKPQACLLYTSLLL